MRSDSRRTASMRTVATPTVALDTGPSRHGGLWPLVLLLLLGAGGGVVVWLGLAHTGHSVRPWLVIALGVAGSAVVAALRVVAVQVPAPARQRASTSARVLTDRERGGQGRLARILESGIVNADRFDIRVRPHLIALAEHRLRRAHGVDLWHEPDRAREVLGDDLWQLTRRAPRTPPTRKQLAGWVARIERL